jgi:3-oxoacyl-[acyl-carrier-protein] synthase-3
MTRQHNVGILGLGTFIPEEVRRNDWWPPETVERWRQKHAQRKLDDDPAAPPSEGPVRAAVELVARDLFQGSVERHVMAEDMQASDMEIAAGRNALASASIAASDIDLLLVSSWVPDLVGTNAACTVHEGLGLPAAGLCLSVDSNFNAFHHQLALAEALIASGQARYGLLVQSASISRLMSPEQQYSPWFGDGATAVVVGRVAEGVGVLGSAHRADGTLQRALLAGVPGGRWFDEGRSVLYSDRPDRQQQVLARVCESSGDVIASALAEAQLGTADVDFYAGHQGTWWYREVTQANAGLSKARAIDSFARFGSMAACNVPMVLSLGLERGLLHDGDIVVTHAGGNGSTWSALVMRWGTGATR